MRCQSIWDDEYWMSSNGFYCGFNMPRGLKSKDGVNGVEVGHSLPPYNKRRAFLVDEFPACPSNWMVSEGKLTSYFVPVEESNGMWLDFNKNWDHSHDVAIVVSIQGINPITGLPCSDPHLEQYVEKCPKCDKKFGPNRFCKECGFSWPKQNYICTTGTPNNQLWLDGFRAADGIVRQYILTQEKLKGVANAIVGEDRVFAVGISFFISKDKKKVTQEYSGRISCANTGLYNTKYHGLKSVVDQVDFTATNYNNSTLSYTTSTSLVQTAKGSAKKKFRTMGGGASVGSSNASSYVTGSSIGQARGIEVGDMSLDANMTCDCYQANCSVEKLEVGAGARILQVIHDDPENLDYWRSEPEAILCINYCSEKETKAIYDKGRVQLTSHKEGFLKDIPFGNV